MADNIGSEPTTPQSIHQQEFFRNEGVCSILLVYTKNFLLFSDYNLLLIVLVVPSLFKVVTDRPI